MKITKLSSLLRQAFKLHKSRIKCLAQFILAIIQERTVNMARIATVFEGVELESGYTRLRRFVREIILPYEKLAYLIVSILGLNKRGRWDVIFDRTNWKLGKKYINILFLAVCLNGISIPIFFKFLTGKKSGNSNQADRIELIKRFIRTFGKKCLGTILGDREFIGQKWMNWLNKERIPFCIRLKEDWNKATPPNGQSMEIKKCFPGLKNGEVRNLGLCKLGEGKESAHCYITGMLTEEGDWIIIAHSEGLKDPCEFYKQRWQIESMFKAMKTGGFNLEDTHLTLPERLECLIGILSIVCAICYKSGEIVVKKNFLNQKNTAFGPNPSSASV